MFSEILEQNKPQLEKTSSYLLPHWCRIMDLLKQLEQTAGPQYHEAFTCRHLAKGEYLLREGTVCQHLWFLQKGIGRVFAQKDGTEATRYIFFPGEPVDAHTSSLLRKPSAESIQVITDAVVYSLPGCKFDQLKQTYPLITEIKHLIIESYVTWLEQRLYRMQHLDATAHYRYLLQTQPLLLCCVPLTYIASYLGISLETLSRIRARITQECGSGVPENTTPPTSKTHSAIKAITTKF
jgi:CRP-like cAMP-binding protein